MKNRNNNEIITEICSHQQYNNIIIKYVDNNNITKKIIQK